MTTTNWIFANVCYFILFIVNFPAYVVDNWTCEDSTRQKHKFAVKYARTSIKSKCLSVYGVKLWNKVPSSISLDSSFLSFKRNYKSYLLCEY